MNATVACMLLWTHGWKTEPVKLEMNIARLHSPHMFTLPESLSDRFSDPSSNRLGDMIEELATTAICDDKSPCFTKVLGCH